MTMTLLFFCSSFITLGKTESHTESIEYTSPTIQMSIVHSVDQLIIAQKERKHDFKIKNTKTCIKNFADYKNSLAKQLLMPLFQNQLLNIKTSDSPEKIKINNKSYAIKKGQKIVSIGSILNSSYKQGLLLKAKCEKKK